MKREIDLLNGPIMPTLAKLAGPIMATGFVQMAYNLTDMFWLGKLSSGAVTAAGLAGMFMWLASGLALMVRMGTQVKVGQLLGAGEYGPARQHAAAGFQLDIVLALAFTVLALGAAPALIGFFNLSSPETVVQGIDYLHITCGLCIFSFINMLFTGILNAMGNSRTPFRISSIGLIINIVLDPLMIFGVGPVPAMGVVGAAWATVIAQLVVCILYVYSCQDTDFFRKLPLLRRQPGQTYNSILRIGAPSGLGSMLFSVIAMVVSRQLSVFGDGAIAAQKVGVQIESISWMTADGFGSAANAFVAQNYGARRYERVRQGMRSALVITVVWGLFCVGLLTIFAERIFTAFISDPALTAIGASYLRILGYSEMLNCVEITCAGIFNGLGRTLPPSITEIVLTAIRIPLVSILSATPLGLDGAWWSCSISCILKGAVLFIWLVLALPRMLKDPTDGRDDAAA